MVWLIKNGKLSTREHDIWFWHRLSTYIHQPITQCLKFQNPTIYHHNEPPDYKMAIVAGQFGFSDDTFNTTYNNSITTCLKSITCSSMSSLQLSFKAAQCLNNDFDNEDPHHHPQNMPQKVCIKVVHFESSISKMLMHEIKELTGYMHRLNVNNMAYMRCYTHLVCLTPAVAHLWDVPTRLFPAPLSPQ